MALTKEERADRIEMRRRENEARKAALPGAYLELQSPGVDARLIFDDGETFVRMIRDPLHMPKEDRMSTYSFYIAAELGDFARFIGALIARYNYQVREANESAAKVEALRALVELPATDHTPGDTAE